MSRPRRLLLSCAALTVAGAATAPAASAPTPVSGSKMITGAYGASVLQPPSTIPCSALQEQGDRYNVVLGARYARGAKARTVEAVLISGPGTTTPTYLRPPKSGSGSVYGNMPVNRCGGQQYRVRYKIVRKGTLAAKRVTVSFTVTGS